MSRHEECTACYGEGCEYCQGRGKVKSQQRPPRLRGKDDD